MKAYNSTRYFVSYHYTLYGVTDEQPFKTESFGSQAVRVNSRKLSLNANDLSHLTEHLRKSIGADYLEIISFQKM